MGVAWHWVCGKPSEANREDGYWDNWPLWLLPRRGVVLALVSLHYVQVFRLLLKTSVERNIHELNLFLSGSAIWQSLVHL